MKYHDSIGYNLTDDQVDKANAGGIAIARDSIEKIKNKCESAPVNATYGDLALEGFNLAIRSLTAQTDEALFLREWERVWELRVARLHIRRAIILMRESMKWLKL
jgi:hypothetical protein